MSQNRYAFRPIRGSHLSSVVIMNKRITFEQKIDKINIER